MRISARTSLRGDRVSVEVRPPEGGNLIGTLDVTKEGVAWVPSDHQHPTKVVYWGEFIASKPF